MRVYISQYLCVFIYRNERKKNNRDELHSKALNVKLHLALSTQIQKSME